MNFPESSGVIACWKLTSTKYIIGIDSTAFQKQNLTIQHIEIFNIFLVSISPSLCCSHRVFDHHTRFDWLHPSAHSDEVSSATISYLERLLVGLARPHFGDFRLLWFWCFDLQYVIRHADASICISSLSRLRSYVHGCFIAFGRLISKYD